MTIAGRPEAVDPDGQDADDVRVLAAELDGDLDLAHEALGADRVVDGEHLDRDVPLDGEVAGLVDHRVAAPADLDQVGVPSISSGGGEAARGGRHALSLITSLTAQILECWHVSAVLRVPDG